MPQNSPLTKTPMPLLSDVPNIETATHPGFQQLEKYTIPRFSTTSARNAAFSGITPGQGQLVYIASKGHLGYELWTGSEWMELGEYTRLRTFSDYRTSDLTTSSGSYRDIVDVVVPAGTWKMECEVYYKWEEDEAKKSDEHIIFNFNYPGSLAARISYLVIDYTDPDGFNQRFQLESRSSGSFDIEAGLRNNVDILSARFTGIFRDTNAGEIACRVKKNKFGQGRVKYYEGSFMELTRLD